MGLEGVHTRVELQKVCKKRKSGRWSSKICAAKLNKNPRIGTKHHRTLF